MTVESAQEELLRIIEKLEKRICSDAPRPERKHCVRLIDDTVIAVEDVAKACPDSGISSAVNDQVVWMLVWLKRVYGWPGGRHTRA